MTIILLSFYFLEDGLGVVVASNNFKMNTVVMIIIFWWSDLSNSLFSAFLPIKITAHFMYSKWYLNSKNKIWYIEYDLSKTSSLVQYSIRHLPSNNDITGKMGNRVESVRMWNMVQGWLTYRKGLFGCRFFPHFSCFFLCPMTRMDLICETKK